MNANAFREFASVGVRFGNDVGSTGRLVAARKDEAGHSWILAADHAAPYYGWGETWQWRTWLGFFAAPGQPVRVVPTDSLATLRFNGPVTVFMRRSVWEKAGSSFRELNRVDSVTNVVPSGALIAVEAGVQRSR